MSCFYYCQVDLGQVFRTVVFCAYAHYTYDVTVIFSVILLSARHTFPVDISVRLALTLKSFSYWSRPTPCWNKLQIASYSVFFIMLWSAKICGKSHANVHICKHLQL